MLHDRDMKKSSLLNISRFFPVLYLVVTVVPMLALLYWNHERVNHVNAERRKQISAYIAKDIQDELRHNLTQEENRLERLVNSLDKEKNVSLDDYRLLLEIDSLAWMPETPSQSNTPFLESHKNCIDTLQAHRHNQAITGGYCLIDHKLETVFLISAAHHSELLTVSEPVEPKRVVPQGPHQAEFFTGTDLSPQSRMVIVNFHRGGPHMGPDGPNDRHHGPFPDFDHPGPNHPGPDFGPPHDPNFQHHEGPFGHPPGDHGPFPNFDEHRGRGFQSHDHAFIPPPDDLGPPPPDFEDEKKPHQEHFSFSLPFFGKVCDYRPEDFHNRQLEKVGRQIPIADINGKTIATIVLRLPDKPPNSKGGDDNQWIGTLILITGLISSVMIGYYIEHTFIVPFTRLSLLTESVQSGDLSQRVSVSHVKHPEVRQTLSNFNNMLQDLEEKAKLRHNFISNLTHDFRTPLIAQARAVELLIEDLSAHPQQESDNKPLQLLRSLLRNNEHLLSMVNQLLETYQHESGNLALNWESVSLPELISDCFSRLEPLATQHQISLSQEFIDNFPTIEGDIGCLSRVFMNLIGNAIENIPKNCSVTVTGQIDPENSRFATIHVRDNGQGLPAEMLNSLFERYATATNVTRKIGSGIGLYICKIFVEAHGGSISVESVLASHTDFKISLPISQKG
jgi:signal transduction histidine kinase